MFAFVCGEQIAKFKDYSFGWHYETKHGEINKNSTNAESARTSEALLAKLQKQEGFFLPQASQIQGYSKYDQLCDISQNR